jgi:hypothetical protein
MPYYKINKAMKTFYGALEQAGMGPNNFIVQSIQAFDPTRAKLPDLKLNPHPDLSVRIDGGTTKNVVKNLTLGVFGN